MLWGQNFFKQNMMSNGYGPKTFGLFTQTGDPNTVKINVIQGAYPLSSYTYNDRSKMDLEINNYFAGNPSQKTSEHTLIIIAVPDPSTANVPFYGVGKNCYALDYPQLDLQYMGTTGTYGTQFTGWYGGMLHELGHGLNVKHSHQTNSEYNNPNKGTNLMYNHGTLGSAPTFLNRASCATLNTCQVFADSPGTYYNGSTSGITSLHAVYDNGDLVVSGTFQSNRPVTDVNIYQDPYPTPSAGYYRVAWSVSPVGNAFSVRMPVSDLEFTNQAYNLQIELRLQNGEYQSNFTYYPYSYVNGVPNINIDFGTVSTCVGNSLQLATNISGTSYQWQYQSGGNWYNYPEATVPGYAAFSGTHTPTMTISGISAAYIANPNTARAAVTLANGTTTYSTPQVWKADGIITQPVNKTACVGGSLQLSAQASGTSYQWQYFWNGYWYDYPEGNNGVAIFSGSKTSSMTVSNISAAYVTTPNQARLLVFGGSGCYTASNTVTWKADGISVQPVDKTACVGGSLQLSAQASGASYQWQYLWNGAWYNYPEGNNGYAVFSGSKTPSMTVSNISAGYVTNPNQARLLVTGTNGCTTTSNTVTWKAINCSGKAAITEINETKEINTIQSVYPNPVKDELTVNTGSKGDQYQVEVITNLGQVLYTTITSDKTLKIPFSEKPAGTYLVTIKSISNGSSKSFRVIKK